LGDYEPIIILEANGGGLGGSGRMDWDSHGRRRELRRARRHKQVDQIAVF
jgi:hypothetical protein